MAPNRVIPYCWNSSKSSIESHGQQPYLIKPQLSLSARLPYRFLLWKIIILNPVSIFACKEKREMPPVYIRKRVAFLFLQSSCLRLFLSAAVGAELRATVASPLLSRLGVDMMYSAPSSKFDWTFYLYLV